MDSCYCFCLFFIIYSTSIIAAAANNRTKGIIKKTDYINVRNLAYLPPIDPTPEIPTEENEGTDPNYPYQEIENYLNSHPKEKKFFIRTAPQIGLRGGWSNKDDEDGESLCRVKRNQYYAPQILGNLRGENRTIVNHAQYQQFIETERCVQPNVSDFKCANLRAGFNSVCHQSFKAVKLAFFNSTMGIGFDLFRIPSCCVCKLKTRD
ncbi:uncharacterized protein [Euwallacea similis]|uniref:uncharacterized protein n=1 Tax=Euwallacea similis TaxID=1736056 RepID=UPI00344EE0E4